jgi:hypothetical protein
MAEEYQRRTYEDLSNELQKVYPVAARAFELIPLMYNRLTLVDGLTHRNAFERIVADHQHLSGFSARNIRRHLPSDSLTVPKRVRPSWPKNSITESSELPRLSSIERENVTGPELHHQNDAVIYCSSDNRKSILDFEFSLLWEDVHQYMGLIFKANGSIAKVWFNGRINTETGKVIAASVGNIPDNK